MRKVLSATSISRVTIANRSLSTLPYSFQRALSPRNEKNDINFHLPLTKIVATIGPASEQLQMLSKVFDAGLNVMRINFSHATYEEADLRTNNLNTCREKDASVAIPNDGWMVNTRSVMLDTQGPEIRTGSFEGAKEVELVAGTQITVTTNPALRTKQTPTKLWISYKELPATVNPGDVFLLDDGAISLEVLAHLENGDLSCRVVNTGVLGNKKGVNMPGLKVLLPAISEKDKADLVWGLKNNIDCIAASFIRKPSDVLEIRSFCEQKIKELSLSNATVPLIISKIESTEGLENFHDILKVSDAIMVARGDLGVEIPLETLTAVQKEIVSQCNRACKPVIVATQMLESMQKNPRPTRAEVTDVANAVLDGADCVMLSGESAKGKYPIDSVAMQRKVVQETEMILQKKSLHLIDDFHTLSHLPNNQYGDHTKDLVSQIRSSNSSGILLLFEDEQMNVEIAKLLSKSKLFIPIFLPVGSYKTARLLSLYQSLYPLVNSTPNPTQEIVYKQMQERFGKETFAKIKKNMTIFNEKSI